MKFKSSKPSGNAPRGVRKKTMPSTISEVAQDQLQAARSQLLVYAKDLKQMLDKEEKKTQQLKQAHAQLLTYAKDLKVALDVEQHKNNELEQAYTDTMLRLARASRYKDEETGAHIERLSHYAQSMALILIEASSPDFRAWQAWPTIQMCTQHINEGGDLNEILHQHAQVLLWHRSARPFNVSLHPGPGRQYISPS
jgi:hypothetical protein